MLVNILELKQEWYSVSDNYDEIDIEIRPVEELTARLGILLATGRRVELETDVDDLTDEALYAAETDRFELFAWVGATFSSYATESEMALLQTEVSKLELDAEAEHGFDSESALALGWAMGLSSNLDFHLPPIGAIDELRKIGPRPWDPREKVNKRLVPLSEEVVWAERERWYLIALRGLGDDFEDVDDRIAALQQIVEDAEVGGMATRDGDLLIGSTRFDDLDADSRSVLLGTADAYVKALTWACGIGSTWDDVPIDDI